MLIYLPNQTEVLMTAFANFAAGNMDPKAQILIELSFLNNGTVSPES